MSTGMVCFLIDDDEDDRDFFKAALEKADPPGTCECVKNGLEALKFVREHDSFIPDFIFIDLNMPFITGLECLEELQNVLHLENVPMIIYSTSSNGRDMEEARKAGAAHYITKPIALADLISIINEVFRREHLPFVLGRDVGSMI